MVNDSLKMTKGKIAAQAGHATLGCALMMKEVNPRVSACGLYAARGSLWGGQWKDGCLVSEGAEGQRHGRSAGEGLISPMNPKGREGGGRVRMGNGWILQTQ